MSKHKNILKLRRKLGISQARLAFEIEVSQESVSQVERGARPSSVKMAINIVKFAKKNGIDLTLEDILCDE